MIKLVESAGFKLAAKSEINANPKDNANHKSGVWSLPPTLADKDERPRRRTWRSAKATA